MTVLLAKIQAHQAHQLSAEELDEAIVFFGTLETGLRLLGPHYHLAWQEVQRTWMALRGFRTLRDACADPTDRAYDWKRGLLIPCPVCAVPIGEACDLSENDSATRPSGSPDAKPLHRVRVDAGQAHGRTKGGART
jgi:hypothetical protein